MPHGTITSGQRKDEKELGEIIKAESSMIQYLAQNKAKGVLCGKDSQVLDSDVEGK